MIYVYAIADHGDSLPKRGLEGRPLGSLSSGGLAAVYSCHECSVISPSADAVRRHEEVVEQLMNDRAILPARFGTTFPEDLPLSQTLRTYAQELKAGLDRVRGQVEIGVRAIWQVEEGQEMQVPRMAAESQSGREYMSARQAENRIRQARHDRLSLMAEEIHQSLVGDARTASYRLTVQPVAMFTGAYLIAPSAIECFRRRVDQFAAARDDLHLLCTGPWPPYHFVPSLPWVARRDLGTPFA